MEKNDKVLGTILIKGLQEINFKGTVKNKRKMFGRSEILVKVDRMDPFWITEDRLNIHKPLK